MNATAIVIKSNLSINILRNNGVYLALLFLILACTGCQPHCLEFEPVVCYTPPAGLIECLPSPFPPLTPVERATDWGRELYLGRSFAKETDPYRAITCFKSALFLVPRTHERRIEIEYEVFISYYLANKYQDAVEAFEGSHLIEAPATFPAMRELLIALYDSYIKVDLPERACRVLGLIESIDEETANDLLMQTAVISANIPEIVNASYCSSSNEEITDFLTTYFTESKSVSKARMLNAVLPGAGYYYVGQTKSAITSFLINALFVAAAYQLFDRGYIPAGIIVSSLEAGWYFGGINGAGIEAHQYNEVLYSRLGREVLTKEKLFPILMFEKGF